MRSDFHLMKDLATHTRIGPQERNDSLAKFMSDMQRYVDWSTNNNITCCKTNSWLDVHILICNISDFRNPQCEEELSGWGLKVINLYESRKLGQLLVI